MTENSASDQTSSITLLHVIILCLTGATAMLALAHVEPAPSTPIAQHLLYGIAGYMAILAVGIVAFAFWDVKREEREAARR